MDKALFHSYKFCLGQKICATSADKNKYYTCLSCGEEVFLKKGDKNKPHFSHKKSDDIDCDQRINTRYASYTSSFKTDIKVIKKWYQQQKNTELVYNPELPDILFNEESTWQIIADILIDEINGKDYIDQNIFQENLVKHPKIKISAIVRHFLDEVGISEKDLLNLYWEIFLRFRLIYRLYKSFNKPINEWKSERVINYIRNKVKPKNKSEGVSLKIEFDENSKIISCHQPFETHTRNVALIEAPYSIIKCKKKYKTPEIKKIIECKYLIAEYNEFESCYISTNKQITIGSQVMILGEINQLKEMKSSIATFSDEEINIIQNIENLNPNWGVIIFDVSMPENMPLSNCPEWIAWHYMDLCGGVRLRKQEQPNTFLESCPPAIQLNANISSDKIEVIDEDYNTVAFERINNKLIFKDMNHGQYSVLIKNTPYSISFNLLSPEKSKDLPEYEAEWGWSFEDNWPTIKNFLDKAEENFLSGIMLKGDWNLGSEIQLKADKEWFLLQSNLIKNPENEINKLLTGWRLNAFR